MILDALDDPASNLFVRTIYFEYDSAEITVNGIFNWVDSNIPAYDFDRFIGGVYVTYVF